MTVLNTHSPFFKLLAPSIGLMSRLRFTQKLILIGSAFTLTSIVFATILILRENTELETVRNEAMSGAAMASLHQTLQSMQQFRLQKQRIQAGDTSATGGLKPFQEKAEKGLATFSAWNKDYEQGASLADTLKSINGNWAKVVSSESTPEQSIAANDQAIAGVLELSRRVADSTGLTLDPFASTYYLGQAISTQLPLVQESASRQVGLGVQVLGIGAAYVDDKVAIKIAQATLVEGNDSAKRALVRATATDQKLAALIGAKLKAAEAAVTTINGEIASKVVDAEELTVTVPTLIASGAGANDSIEALYSVGASYLQQQLDARHSKLEGQRALAVAALCIALLISAYLFLGFTVSTRMALDELSGAATNLANGHFPERIAVATRDELRSIANDMEGVCRTLREFASEQTEMFRRHDIGDIEYFIPHENFKGSFSEMARNGNTLVAAHIGTIVRMLQIATHYGKGDLSVDMDRLPGKKAELTKVMDATKASLQRVNGELQRLVDAAVAGDFSVRGDVDSFEYAYRDMIVSINQLMESSETGLGEIGSLLAAVATGDLNQRITVDLQGQFKQVSDNANQTVSKLSAIVSHIRQGVDAISTASGEIVAGNSDLSARTEQQAASLEETASSMEELTATVRQNAENARQANQLAIGASGVAVKGGDVVASVVTTMEEINHSSRKIVDIISVIDGIAFQTNILALNAAVEAARAGEQGRGFAVVAAEVRSLAQRSAAAAKEIKVLIGDSVDKVTIGSRQVSEAGATMTEIVASVKRVTDIMSEITTASQEQSTGIEQVNRTITQMDEVTQQNAAMVEEATAAAHSLEDQAKSLEQAVSVFRMGTSTQQTAAVAKSVTTKPASSLSPPRGKSIAGIAKKGTSALRHDT